MIQDQGKGNTRRRAWVALATAIAVTAVGGAAIAAGHLQPSMTDTQDLLQLSDGDAAGGTSMLTRTDDAVMLTMEAESLHPRHAHTVWWVVFNNPDACSDDCGEDDVFVDGDPQQGFDAASIQAVGAAIGHATGNVSRADGTAEFGARLERDSGPDGHQVLLPAGMQGDSLLTVSGMDAEVHVVVQDHGRAVGVGRRLINQLSRFQAGCSPHCEDVQFAVHLP